MLLVELMPVEISSEVVFLDQMLMTSSAKSLLELMHHLQ